MAKSDKKDKKLKKLRKKINSMPQKLNGSGKGNVTPHFFRKLSLFHDLSEKQISHIQAMESRHVAMPAGTDIISAGEKYTDVYVLNEGWAVRYRILPDGSRQIANFILPGDFMCLNACIFTEADFNITTITPVRVSQFPTCEVVQLTEKHPLMCAAMFWSNAREESIIIEHLASVGRRTAYSRVSHLILELWRRLEMIGQVEKHGNGSSGSFHLPLTQQLIADCLGLSSIHVNRTLRALEEDGFVICERKDGVRLLRIADIEGLTEASAFDDEFLRATPIPTHTSRLLEEVERRRSQFSE
ncbi:MAG: Crp/Fnr family transcriptional regulator [Hyphomicrobiaceae bacterium]|nr:Crp/Fnr family transcriptional regulator [Hyphomicrobiaceae bacterium]MCC0011604.1 Crp/Fnr family transcriptional regulator [Hyphomicrobiaceae bacterium]